MPIITKTKEVINITASNKVDFDNKMKEASRALAEKGYKTEIINFTVNMTRYSSVFLATVRGYVIEREWNEDEK